jgi:hypothetical protein
MEDAEKSIKYSFPSRKLWLLFGERYDVDLFLIGPRAPS